MAACVPSFGEVAELFSNDIAPIAVDVAWVGIEGIEGPFCKRLLLK
jgi:hypothetical protein